MDMELGRSHFALTEALAESGELIAAAAGTSEHQVAAWVVQDLQTEVAELRRRSGGDIP